MFSSWLTSAETSAAVRAAQLPALLSNVIGGAAVASAADDAIYVHLTASASCIVLRQTSSLLDKFTYDAQMYTSFWSGAQAWVKGRVPIAIANATR